MDTCPDVLHLDWIFLYRPYKQCIIYSSGFSYTSHNKVRGIETGNNTSYQLDLNVFRSGIDPNFAVLSFELPTLSATSINGNTFGTFFLHKFTTSVWDLDHLFWVDILKFLETKAPPLTNPILISEPF